jgi:hypothetical protein
MNKIISFSIWGNKPMYCVGAIRNAQLAKEIFPEWTCYFFYNNTVPKIYIEALNAFDNTITHEITDSSYGAWWRFYPMIEGNVVLSRDTDSRLSHREKRIVDDWMASDYKLCVMRDHIRHYDFNILSGMWGIKDGMSSTIYKGMESKLGENYYAAEQIYVSNTIWPAYENSRISYGIKETQWMRDSYKDIGKDFIGQQYDDNEIPVYEGQLE